jgi:hypothetical protein
MAALRGAPSGAPVFGDFPGLLTRDKAATLNRLAAIARWPDEEHLQ